MLNHRRARDEVHRAVLRPQIVAQVAGERVVDERAAGDDVAEVVLVDAGRRATTRPRLVDQDREVGLRRPCSSRQLAGRLAHLLHRDSLELLRPRRGVERVDDLGCARERLREHQPVVRGVGQQDVDHAARGRESRVLFVIERGAAPGAATRARSSARSRQRARSRRTRSSTGTPEVTSSPMPWAAPAASR